MPISDYEALLRELKEEVGRLSQAFPDIGGVSPRNLKYIRAFAEAYPEATLCEAGCSPNALVPQLQLVQ